MGNSSCDSENEAHPVPPPRTKRKAKKSRKEKCDTLLKEEKERKEKKEKKEDLEWYSSSPKFGIPPVPTISGEDIISEVGLDVVSVNFTIVFSLIQPFYDRRQNIGIFQFSLFWQ